MGIACFALDEYRRNGVGCGPSSPNLVTGTRFSYRLLMFELRSAGYNMLYAD